MTWVPGSTRFHMTLSVMVPVVIKQSVRPFVEQLLQRVGVDFEHDKHRLIFAIHPGGPKIVEHIQEALGLEPDQVAISNSVFYRERQHVFGDGPAHIEGDCGGALNSCGGAHRLSRLWTRSDDHWLGGGKDMSFERAKRVERRRRSSRPATGEGGSASHRAHVRGPGREGAGARRRAAG